MTHNNIPDNIDYKKLAAEMEAKMPSEKARVNFKAILVLAASSIFALVILTIYIVVPFAAVANSFYLSFGLNVAFGVLVLIGISMVVFDILMQTSKDSENE